jgi:uncharacterized protein YaiE (UPF0345 family)
MELTMRRLACVSTAIAALLLPTIAPAQVTSVFGRTGAVTAQSGDYTCTLVTNCGPTNATNTWTGANTFGPQTDISVTYDGTTSGPTYIPIFYHTCAQEGGIVSPRSAALLQIVGCPQYAAGSDEEINLLSLFGYGGNDQLNLERYDRGTVPTNAATSMSSNTLHFAATPYWVVAGAVVTDVTAGGASVGTASSTTTTTIVLVNNSSIAVASGDVLNILNPNNGAVLSGESIGGLAADPYDGTSDATTAGIGFATTENQVHDTHHGTDVVISYTPNNAGSNKRYDGITISHSGHGGVTVGDTGYQSPPTDLGSGTLNVVSDVMTGGHFRTDGNHGSLSSCGASANFNGGTDQAGQISVGPGVTSCTYTFNTAWAAAPVCIAQTYQAATPTTYVTSQSGSSFTVNFSAAFTGAFEYICMGIP